MIANKKLHGELSCNDTAFYHSTRFVNLLCRKGTEISNIYRQKSINFSRWVTCNTMQTTRFFVRAIATKCTLPEFEISVWEVAPFTINGQTTLKLKHVVNEICSIYFILCLYISSDIILWEWLKLIPKWPQDPSSSCSHGVPLLLFYKAKTNSYSGPMKLVIKNWTPNKLIICMVHSEVFSAT